MKDIFDEIFGQNEEFFSSDKSYEEIFEQIRKGYSNSAEKFGTQAKALEKQMLTPPGLYLSIAKDNTKWIYKYQNELLNHRDSDMKVAFSVVCAYDKNNDLAYKSLRAIPGNAKQIVESRGLVLYEQGRCKEAIQTLQKNQKTDMTKYGLNALSLSYLQLGKNDISLHEDILSNVKSDISLRILGTLSFNNEDYPSAKNYFDKAWRMKKNETNLLNVLAAQRNLEDSYAANEYVRAINNYLLETPVVPSRETIDEYIYQTSLNIPKLNLGNKLYQVLKIVNQR